MKYKVIQKIIKVPIPKSREALVQLKIESW